MPPSGPALTHRLCAELRLLLCAHAVELFLISLINVPMSLRYVAAASLVSGVCSIIVVLAFGLGLGIWPIPYMLMLLGSVSLLVGIPVLLLGYPARVRKRPDFRRRLCFAIVIVVFNIIAAFLCLFYNALFLATTGYTQKLVALGLPLVKWSVKVASKKIAMRMGNKEFAHGSGFFASILPRITPTARCF